MSTTTTTTPPDDTPQSVRRITGWYANFLLAAFVILPHGQGSLSWFGIAALAGMVVMVRLGSWQRSNAKPRSGSRPAAHRTELPTGQVARAIGILIALIVSKYVYLSSITSYYIFYLIDRFGLSTGDAQLCLFVFLAAVAAGTVIGGPVGDRIGRKTVIWVSILGILPFTLALDVDDGMQLMQREIFGPILPVLTYRELDQAIAYVNAHERPLGIYVFSAHPASAHRVLGRTVSGGACINCAALQAAVPSLPFGGIGKSGSGRHHGHEGFLEFSNLRSVVERGQDDLVRAMFAPYGELADALIAAATGG